MKLSHEAIRKAALELIDKHGLEALSMRKLGTRLGVEGMALYWYFPNKDALLDAVVDELMADVGKVIAREATDYFQALRQIALAYRRVAQEHPKAFPLLATRRFASEDTYDFLEQLFELARAEGIDDRTTARFYRVVSSYCNGFALSELATPRTAKLRKKYARVSAVSAWLAPEHLDDIFEFGLELQLEALRHVTKKARR